MFGFGAGSIDIKVNSFSYKLGDTIEGTVQLKLKGPMKARGVFITLLGESRSRTKNPSTHRAEKSKTIEFELKQPLDGEKEYPATSEPMVYPFKLVIPPKLPGVFPPASAAGGILGGIANVAVSMLGASAHPVSYYLVAKLDVPMAVDVSKKIQIGIVA
jgi:hypothetical protein